MDEHEDDLTSEVETDATEETDAYAETADELDDDSASGDLDIDPDESEL